MGIYFGIGATIRIGAGFFLNSRPDAIRLICWWQQGFKPIKKYAINVYAILTDYSLSSSSLSSVPLLITSNISQKVQNNDSKYWNAFTINCVPYEMRLKHNLCAPSIFLTGRTDQWKWPHIATFWKTAIYLCLSPIKSCHIMFLFDTPN